MCEVPLFATQTNWFMEETRLEQSSKYHMEQEGTLRRLTIHNVTTNDDGVYICEMKEGSRTVAELTVRGMVEESYTLNPCLHFLVLKTNTFPSQATLLRSFLGGRWFPSATPSSSVWSWSIPAPMPTGPATARNWRKIHAFPSLVCSGSTHSQSENAEQMTLEKLPLWLETARLPLDSLWLVRRSPECFYLPQPGLKSDN